MITSLTPCLWFDGKALEAAEYYVSLFPDSHIASVNRSNSDWPGGKAGDPLMVVFSLAGRSFSGLNGGPHYRLTEAFSLMVNCETQKEIDLLWDALSAHPENEMCGWCKDRFGLSWQIIPSQFATWMSNPASAGRVMAQMMKPMKKLDIAILEAAAKG
jgi:predicted 3-demethylubiquinone-9 3-methyltransferase (glyoxalase superfamily)